MIDYIKRLAGPYTTAGQSVFPFGFAIFEPTDVYVAVGDGGPVQSETLTYGSDYTVSLNADQNATPGGTVTLTSGLASGQVLVVGSAQPYTQTMQLTNYSRFPPEIINKALDRIVIEIQQILEHVGRTVTVPVTSSSTPGEVLTAILDTASRAADYSEQAAAALEEAKALRDTVEQDVTATGDAQVERVTQAGDEQVALVDGAADAARQEVQVGYGVGCSEEVWTASGDTAEGEAVTLPNSMQYVVGRHHLRVAWNGCELMRGVNFAEVGDTDAWSGTITTLMPISTGDELMAWTVPLGRGDTTGVDVRLDSLEDSLADLSRRVVYKDE